jgi:hypothetical protein
VSLTREFWLRRIERILTGEVKAVGLDEATKRALWRDLAKLRRALKTPPALETWRRQTRDRVRRHRERQRGTPQAVLEPPG